MLWTAFLTHVCVSLSRKCSHNESEISVTWGGMYHVGNREERKISLSQLDLK